MLNVENIEKYKIRSKDRFTWRYWYRHGVVCYMRLVDDYVEFDQSGYVTDTFFNAVAYELHRTQVERRFKNDCREIFCDKIKFGAARRLKENIFELSYDNARKLTNDFASIAKGLSGFLDVLNAGYKDSEFRFL